MSSSPTATTPEVPAAAKPMPQGAWRRLIGRLAAPFGRLYWRTFLLIVLLVSASLAVWFQSFRQLELGPQVEQTSRQITSLIDLTRLALVHSDPQTRLALHGDLARREGIYIYPRNPDDRWEPTERSEFNRRLERSVDQRLGEELQFASRVNGREGLWIGFRIEGDPYWLLLDRARIDPILGETWAAWSIAVTLLGLIGAAIIASFVNRPLQQLRRAIARVGAGDYSYKLDETAGMAEIREVFRGFNRMARSLQEVEEERALMLAGISHDIRTPLARLRLEAEMSVPDEQARDNMIEDIEQADRIISKFLEYARSVRPPLETVDVNAVLDSLRSQYQRDETVVLRLRAEPLPPVRANTLELQRVLVNLIENAKRYGLTPGEVHTDIDLAAEAGVDGVHLTLRDHGPGVPPEQIDRLTQPFFRGDAARTSAKGTGLGLSIVEKTVQAMGGRLALRNAVPGTGLQAEIWLPLAGPDHQSDRD